MTDSFKETAELAAKAILGEDITKASVEKIEKSLGETKASETGEKKAILQALKELEDPSALCCKLRCFLKRICHI